MILVGSLDDIPLGEAVRVEAEVPIAVFNVDGELFAIDDMSRPTRGLSGQSG